MPVTGTSGNDLISFQGSMQQVDTTLVNPYSGLTASVNDIKNVNTTTYDGGAGTDVMFMSPNGDMLVLNDGSGNATVTGIERFAAGDGDDVIQLADATLTMGNTLVSGGEGNDILWTNTGNDTINAAGGNDLVAGGPGSDALAGDDGDDTLYGGTSDDSLQGGNGNDFLYGDDGSYSSSPAYTHVETLIHSFSAPAFPIPFESAPHIAIPVPNQGISTPNVAVDYSTTVTITFTYTSAGYNNGLGVYTVAADGTIQNVDLLFKNQHIVPTGTDFTYQFAGAPGTSIGFFITANGDNTSAHFHSADMAHGQFEFIYDFGQGDQRAAQVTDVGSHVTLVYDNGTTLQNLNDVTVWHSALAGGVPTLNEDGLVHTISGLADANDSTNLRVGFEDLTYLGDADFNDVIFDVHVASQSILIQGASDDDYLDGGPGDDISNGGFGNDILVFGDGNDTVYGGVGQDIFAMSLIDGHPDTIADFQTGPGGDVINLTDVLSGYDPVTSAINNFVHVTHNSGSDAISINATGAPGGVFVHAFDVAGGVGANDAATLMATGNLVADHNVVHP